MASDMRKYTSTRQVYLFFHQTVFGLRSDVFSLPLENDADNKAPESRLRHAPNHGQGQGIDVCVVLCENEIRRPFARAENNQRMQKKNNKTDLVMSFANLAVIGKQHSDIGRLKRTDMPMWPADVLIESIRKSPLKLTAVILLRK